MAHYCTWALYLNCKNTLSDGKAHGPDDDPNETIKWIPMAFHKTIHALFRAMPNHTKTPEAWKRSLTVPICKKGDPSDISNHRLIGLVTHHV